MTKFKRWNKHNVLDFIIRCRTEEKGIPLFFTRWAEVPFCIDGKPAVVGTCIWGRKKHGETVAFYDVPIDDLLMIETHRDDWKLLLKKYADEKTYKKLLNEEIEI